MWSTGWNCFSRGYSRWSFYSTWPQICGPSSYVTDGPCLTLSWYPSPLRYVCMFVCVCVYTHTYIHTHTHTHKHTHTHTAKVEVQDHRVFSCSLYPVLLCCSLYYAVPFTEPLTLPSKSYYASLTWSKSWTTHNLWVDTIVGLF